MCTKLTQSAGRACTRVGQKKSTSRQRSGKGAIRKRYPLKKPRWEKKQTNNQVLLP